MKRLPPCPKVMHTTLGQVPVRQVNTITTSDGKEDAELFGYADFAQRDIQVIKKAALVTRHLVARHEWVHMVLFDAGVRLDEDTEERICDVVSQALVAEMQAKLSTT